MRYSVEHKKRRYVNASTKNLGTKYGQKRLDHVKQFWNRSI